MENMLTHPVLVLNKGWTPIDSTVLKKALCNVISDRATFVDPVSYTSHDIISWMQQPALDNEPFIQTTRSRIKRPDIMLLSEYSRVPVRKVVFCRRNLWRRDHRRCQYCGIEPPIDEITIDHIIPQSKGGESTFENCVLACMSCNLKKGNRLLSQTGMKLRRFKYLSNGERSVVYYETPKRPVWNPLYTLRRKTFPESWKAFLNNFDEAMYWEVGLEK